MHRERHRGKKSSNDGTETKTRQKISAKGDSRSAVGDEGAGNTLDSLTDSELKSQVCDDYEILSGVNHY